ncbi:MAG: hypothetical protein IIC89_00750 [Chloroflexi bacterium]|nr:hypothetical protein [Chloroflexota bacterium]
MPNRMSRTRLVIVASAVAVVAAAFWSWGGSGPERSEALHPKLKTEMHFEIDGTFSGQPQPGAAHCDSRTQTICQLDEGTSFTLHVVPSVIPVGGYVSWQETIDYGSLLYKPAATCTLNPAGCPEVKWDKSVITYRAPAAPTGKEGAIGFADVSAGFSPFPISFQTTAFVNLEFNCARNGQAGEGHTNLVKLADYDEDPSGALYVNFDVNVQQDYVANVSDLTIECIVVTPKQEEPGDTDQDGCSDQAENGAFEYLGGQRNYLYFWDFYDVWTHPAGDPIGWERNKVLNIFDILAVGARFGSGPVLSKADALAQALIAPTNATGYHPAYDRGPIIGANMWDRGPPDGSINIVDDILGIAQQFGHNCA